MQKYSTIIGVIELRSQKIGYATTQRRYRIGSSTVTLIMKRFRELRTGKGIHAGGTHPGRAHVYRLDRRPARTADRS